MVMAVKFKEGKKKKSMKFVFLCFLYFCHFQSCTSALFSLYCMEDSGLNALLINLFCFLQEFTQRKRETHRV